MENEMMNNMDAMTENLTDAMPEVDNLVPSVDELSLIHISEPTRP